MGWNPRLDPCAHPGVVWALMSRARGSAALGRGGRRGIESWQVQGGSPRQGLLRLLVPKIRSC